MSYMNPTKAEVREYAATAMELAAYDANLAATQSAILADREARAEMTYEEQERADEEGAEYGDPRRCPRHPGVATSDRWGMFDAPCGECEAEEDRFCAEQEWNALPQAERDAIVAANAAREAARLAVKAASMAASVDIPF